MFAGMFKMTTEGKDTVRFWVQLGMIAFAIVASYFTLSAKADQAIARIEKIESREQKNDEVVKQMKLDVEVTKNNVEWIRSRMEKEKWSN